MTARITALTPRSRLISAFSGYPEHMAVVNDDIVALDAALAAADGDCNLKHNGNSDTPLTLAIRLHRTRIVEHLIAVGANVDSTTGWVAAEFGNERIMEMLLKAGIDPNQRCWNEENTLCHDAARNSDAGVLRVLVAAGAPFDESDMLGRRPSRFAAQNENEEILSILLAAGCSVENHADLASAAAQNRNHKVLAMLMKAGVNVNATGVYSCAPIHSAAQNPNVAVLRLLVDAGVDVNVLDTNGENPLFNACENPNMEMLDALLAAGAEWCDGTERTILHAVARNTNEAMVRRVFELDVDVNARDSIGVTPLMIAAESSTAAVVSVFLEAGADVHAIDNVRKRKSVLQFACKNKNVGIVRGLIAAGARFDAVVLRAAINESNLDAVQALIDAGMNVAGEVNANPSFLFESTWRSRKAEMLEFLIRRGVDFRVVHKGRALCHRAERKCLALLFAHGVNLNVKDSHGQTPIEVVHDDVIATFIAAGISFTHRTRQWTYSFEGSSILAAVGHPQVLPRRQLAWGCHQIAERQFELLRLRAFQVCVGLQSFRLPALVSCEILAHAFAPRESLVAFHRVWAIVTTIKHFRERREPI